MKLQTKIPLKPQDPKIDYDSEILLVGSCFVENIGKKLDFFKFKNSINPFGILFHPDAICNFFENVIAEKEYTEKDIFSHQERWHSFEAHSVLSNPDKMELLKNLNKNSQNAKLQLQKATHVVLTLGTAWGYQLRSTGETVANCHKLPQQEFEKELQSVESIFSSLQKTVKTIRSINSEARIIFSISPVRHLKDGFVENQRSKAHLIAAVHQLLDNFSDSKIAYFPSYEIMMDELRDYRFYATDMLHPSQIAIDYIWEKFTSVWIAPEVFETMKMVENIQNGLQHRPFNSESAQHRKFLEDLEWKKTQLKEQFPHIQF